MARLRIAALAVALAVLAAGCGGGQSDNDKVEATVRDYFTAFAASDWNAACGDLTADARAQVQKAAHVSSCQAALVAAVKRPDVARYQARFRDAKVLDVSVSDGSATAKVSAIGVSTTIPLR